MWWEDSCRPEPRRTLLVVEASWVPLGSRLVGIWLLCLGSVLPGHEWGAFPPERAICIQDLSSLKKICFTSVGIEPSKSPPTLFLNVTTTEAWVSCGKLAWTHAGNDLSPVGSRSSWKWLYEPLIRVAPRSFLKVCRVAPTRAYSTCLTLLLKHSGGYSRGRSLSKMFLNILIAEQSSPVRESCERR